MRKSCTVRNNTEEWVYGWSMRYGHVHSAGDEDQHNSVVICCIAPGGWVFVPEPDGGWKILGRAGGWARTNAGIVKAYGEGRICGTLPAARGSWIQEVERGGAERSRVVYDRGQYWRGTLGVMKEQLIRSGSEWAERNDDDHGEEQTKTEKVRVDVHLLKKSWQVPDKNAKRQRETQMSRE